VWCQAFDLLNLDYGDDKAPFQALVPTEIGPATKLKTPEKYRRVVVECYVICEIGHDGVVLAGVILVDRQPH